MAVNRVLPGTPAGVCTAGMPSVVGGRTPKDGGANTPHNSAVLRAALTLPLPDTAGNTPLDTPTGVGQPVLPPATPAGEDLVAQLRSSLSPGSIADARHLGESRPLPESQLEPEPAPEKAKRKVSRVRTSPPPH